MFHSKKYRGLVAAVCGGLALTSSASISWGATTLDPAAIREFARTTLGLSADTSIRDQQAVGDLVRILNGEPSDVFDRVVMPLRALGSDTVTKGGCEVGTDKNTELAEFTIIQLMNFSTDELSTLTTDKALANAANDPICAPQSGITARIKLSRSAARSAEAVRSLKEVLTQSIAAVMTAVANEAAARQAATQNLSNQASQIQSLVDQDTAALSKQAAALAKQDAALIQHAATLAKHEATLKADGEKLKADDSMLQVDGYAIARHDVTLEAHQNRMDGIDNRISSVGSALDQRITKTENWQLDQDWSARILPSATPKKGAELLTQPRAPYNPPRPEGWTPGTNPQP